MAVTFYNPGNPLVNHMMRYDNPSADIKVMNSVAYWYLNAPSMEFFDVPEVMTLVSSDGIEFEIPVKFADQVQHDYKDYGMIRIDVRRKEINEDDNVATDEKSAKVKGDRMWRDYLIAKSYEHMANVDSARAANMTPRRAQGIYAHALKVLGIEDPADGVGNVIRSNQNVSDMGAMQAQMAEMARTIADLTNQRVTPKGR